MHEMKVSGEIKTLAWKEGSSGVFTGSIEGLYQGYRFGSTTPDERQFDLELPHGSIGVTVRQEIRTPLGLRPSRHPFADGNDPFEKRSRLQKFAMLARLLRHAWVSKSPKFNPFSRVHYMEVMLRVDPERCTGIFAGASGSLELATPGYRMAGYLVVETKHGDLRLDFLERGSRTTLAADLWVDGENSTGLYRNARGELEFALTVAPPNFGRGPYSGTIWLEREPPAA